MRSPSLLGLLAVSTTLVLGGCPQFTSGSEPAIHATPEAEAPAAPPPVARPMPPEPVRVPTPTPRAPAAGDMLAARHILIGYQGAMRAAPTTTRTKDDARALAARLVRKLHEPGADFAAVANEYTDDQSGRGHGGALPPFNRASGFVAPFVDAAYALSPNQISDVVETPFGFHIIQRMP